MAGDDEDERARRRWRLRAEVFLDRPPMMPAMGRVRDALVDLRAEAEADLADADARLRAALDDRRVASDRLQRCARALAGTGQLVDRRTGESRKYLRIRRSAAVADPVVVPDPVVAPADARILRGGELRAALLDLLDVADGELSVQEMQRLLAYEGFAVVGPPSQTIANALAVELEAGRVRRVRRGRYLRADSEAGPDLTAAS